MGIENSGVSCFAVISQVTGEPLREVPAALLFDRHNIHPGTRDGLCWTPRPWLCGCALWSLGTCLAGGAFLEPTSLPAATGRKFCHALQSCHSGDMPGRHWHSCQVCLGWHPMWSTSSLQEQGHQLLEPPAALSLFEAAFFLDCNTFPNALVSLKAGIGLCLQSSICFAGTHKYDSWLNTQPVKPYMNLHVGQVASWRNFPSNKMVNSRAVGKPGEMVMLLEMLSFSNTGNGTQQ